jgi:antitoxin MazE
MTLPIHDPHNSFFRETFFRAEVAANLQEGRRLYLPKVSKEFAMKLQVAKWGDSLAVRLPLECVREIGLREGDEVDAEVTPTGEIRLIPAPLFDKAAFLERLHALHARMPMQTESAGEFVRRMRDEDRF